jgi:hypothetical protein
MQIDFKNIKHLQKGTPRQKAAYQLLSKYQIMEKLKNYDPILVGTIPINIDIAGSDLDIICCMKDAKAFEERITQLFGQEKNFAIWLNEYVEPNAIVSSFFIDDFEIEIFGQNKATNDQNAYRHMLIEHHYLQTKGEEFRKEIIQLKENGLKTEPAFAKALSIDGDPYEALLKLEKGII